MAADPVQYFDIWLKVRPVGKDNKPVGPVDSAGRVKWTYVSCREKVALAFDPAIPGGGPAYEAFVETVRDMEEGYSAVSTLAAVQSAEHGANVRYQAGLEYVPANGGERTAWMS